MLVGDWILILGGIAFWVLAGLCYFPARLGLAALFAGAALAWPTTRSAPRLGTPRRDARRYIFALLGIVFVALGLMI